MNILKTDVITKSNMCNNRPPKKEIRGRNHIDFLKTLLERE